jgi:hypothetical protein
MPVAGADQELVVRLGAVLEAFEQMLTQWVEENWG